MIDYEIANIPQFNKIIGTSRNHSATSTFLLICLEGRGEMRDKRVLIQGCLRAPSHRWRSGWVGYSLERFLDRLGRPRLFVDWAAVDLSVAAKRGQSKLSAWLSMCLFQVSHLPPNGVRYESICPFTEATWLAVWSLTSYADAPWGLVLICFDANELFIPFWKTDCYLYWKTNPKSEVRANTRDWYHLLSESQIMRYNTSELSLVVARSTFTTASW